MLSVSRPQAYEVDHYSGVEFITPIDRCSCTNTALVISLCLPVLLALKFRSALFFMFRAAGMPLQLKKYEVHVRRIQESKQCYEPKHRISNKAGNDGG